jgi:autotransporter-associated beta strand protein
MTVNTSTHRSPFQPRLEVLEDRWLPAPLLTWTGAATDSSGNSITLWSDSHNWKDQNGFNTVPLGGEILVFDSTSNPNNRAMFNDLLGPGGAAKTFSSITISADGYVFDGKAVNSDVSVNEPAGGKALLGVTLTGPHNLIKDGAGELVVIPTNFYTGPTRLLGGTLTVVSDGSLGLGTLDFRNGTIQAGGFNTRTVSNPLVLGSTVTFGGSRILLFTGPATLNGPSTLTITNTGLTEFQGAITEAPGSMAGLFVTGSGQVKFDQSNTLDYFSTGGTVVITVAMGGATGTGRLNLFGGTLQAATNAVFLNSNVLLQDTVQFAGAGNMTFGGAITLFASSPNTAVSVIVSGTGLVTFSGGISGSFGLDLIGSGAVQLTNGTNAYTGNTQVDNGTLIVSNSNVLGSGGLVLNGGSLRVNGNGVVLGNGVSLLRDTTLLGPGDLTLTGDIGLRQGPTRLTVADGTTLTLAGILRQLIIHPMPLLKDGPGTLVLTNPNNSFGGGVTVVAGTLGVNATGALGSGPLYFLSGAHLMTNNRTGISISNNVSALNYLTLDGAGPFSFTTGTFSLVNVTVFTVNTPTLINHAIDDGGYHFSLIKLGTSTLRLNGDNIYSNATIINQGVVEVNGSQPGNAVMVNEMGTLAGGGRFGSLTVTSGGMVNPGTATTASILTASNNVTLNAGSTFHVDLNGTAGIGGTGYDQLNITAGTVTLGNATLDVAIHFTSLPGDRFTILRNQANLPVVGTFNNLPEGAILTVNGTSFRISYHGGEGHDVTLTNARSMPELFVIGLDNQVYAQKLDSNGSSSSGYVLASPGQVKALVTAHDPSNLPEGFVLGMDNQVYALHVNASGNAVSGYFPVAPGQVKSFSVGYDATARPEVFAIGLDNQVYAAKMDANGNPSAGYILAVARPVQSLAVGHDASNRPEVFAIGLDSQVYEQKLDQGGNPSGTSFLTTPGQVKALVVGQLGNAGPELFVIGLDNQVYAQTFDGLGSSTSGYFLGKPGPAQSITLSNSFLPQLFALRPDGQVYEEQFSANGQATVGFGLVAPGAVKAFTIGSYGSFEEGFAIGLDNQVYALKLDANGYPQGGYHLTRPGQVKAVSTS